MESLSQQLCTYSLLLFPSGPSLTPGRMVAGVKKTRRRLALRCRFDSGKSSARQNHLRAAQPGKRMGWVPFRYGISGPVKLVNGATMQALGNYRAGTMLFLGLGAALGSPMVVEGTVVPMDWRTCLL